MRTSHEMPFGVSLEEMVSIDPQQTTKRSLMTGFLLSFSPSTGIDYVNQHLSKMTRDPCRNLYSYRLGTKPEEVGDTFPEKDLSAIAQVYSEFETEGVKKWPQQTPEWLMVYLMTEISSTPHSMRSGYSVPTILDAYDTIVSKLVCLVTEAALKHVANQYFRKSASSKLGNERRQWRWCCLTSRLLMSSQLLDKPTDRSSLS